MKLYRRNLAEVWKVLGEIQDEQKRQHSAVQGQEAGELRRSENFRQLERDSKAGFPLANIFARSDFFPLSLSFRLEPSGTN